MGIDRRATALLRLRIAQALSALIPAACAAPAGTESHGEEIVAEAPAVPEAIDTGLDEGAAVAPGSELYGGTRYSLFAFDGRGLTTASEGSASAVELSTAANDVGSVDRRGFAFEPITSASASLFDGSSVRIRDARGRYLTHTSNTATFQTADPHDVHGSWRITAAIGQLALGRGFRLLALDDGVSYLKSGSDGIRVSAGATSDAIWTGGCFFLPGPDDAGWVSRATYVGSADPTIQREVAWLEEHIDPIQTPMGPIPLLHWSDDTLANSPGSPRTPNPVTEVAYTQTDNLWAAEALKAYDPTTADRMESGLRAMGRFGSGVFDTPFHGLNTVRQGLAPSPALPDPIHGYFLGFCGATTDPATIIEVRAPSTVAEPDTTPPELRATFLRADSAVYQALSDYWNATTTGARDEARAHLRAVVANDGAGDRMFWDTTGGFQRSPAAECGYAAWSSRCAMPCAEGCFSCDSTCDFVDYPYEIALTYYALTVMGMLDEPAIAAAARQMRLRGAEAVTSDGGVAFAIAIDFDGALASPAIGAYGEGTAMSILANSVQPGPR